MRRFSPLPLLAACATLASGCSLPSIPGGNDPKELPTVRDVFEQPDNYVAGDGDAAGFAIAAIDPTRGPVAGGTRVEITGAGFEAGSTLVVGSTEAVEVVVQNQGSILATTPAHPAGWVDVVVRRPDGKTARLEGAFFYEAAVSVQSTEPSEGPADGGTPITVRGAGFAAGTRLLIGGRQAQDVRVLDERTLLAVTPPGAPGPRDVTAVNDSGTGSLRRGYRYAAAPTITRCTPPVAVEGPAFDLVVSGRGLDLGTFAVTPGTAEVLGTPSDGEARLRFTPLGTGPVSVSFQGPGGTASRAACLWVQSAADLADPTPRVLSVTPSSGTAAGGDNVSAIALGFEGAVPDAMTVTVGGAAATQVSVTGQGREIDFRTPPGAMGPADVVIRGPQGQATAPAAFRYVTDVSLTSVDPTFGPAEGGTLVQIEGVGLDQVREVFVGPLPAIVVAGPSATAVRVRTAPCSPGRQDVTVVTGAGRRVVLPGAFVFGATAPDLVAVTPGTGSRAGGTLVSIAGSGFVPGVIVRFGTGTATILDDGDPARLTVRSPVSETIERVDVEVLWPDGQSRRLKQAFGYFDPTGYFGGVWGDAVNGAVNVTVLDSYTNLPVMDAFVILGWESATPFKGRTDKRGQITLSGQDLFGPVQVTASREDYSTSSLVGVDAENLTLHIDPMAPIIPPDGGGGGGATTLAPGLVSGTVAGADKYLLATPDSCADRPLVHGSLCAPCSSDADCGAGSACTQVANGGFHCATSCAVQADCPQGYACYSVGGGRTGCLPGPGRPEVRCGTSVRSPFSTTTSTGPGSIADSKGLYAVSARVGEVAIYCVGGLRRFEDGVFEPVAMGIQRHVPVNSARVTDSIDMDLSIPLDREVDIRLVNAPGGPSGPNDHLVLVALNLGSDGVLRLWPDMNAVDGERFVLRHLPRDFTGPLEDAVLYVHSEANSRSIDTIPYSSSLIPEWKPGQALGVVEVTPKTARLLDPDKRPDATGGCGLPGGGGLVLGHGGRAWTLSPEGVVEDRSSLGRSTFRACSARGDLVLAVGDGGAVVRVGPDGTVVEAAPGAADLRAVTWLADGSAWAAGDGTLLHRTPLGGWTKVGYGSLAPLYGLVGQADGTVWAVGAKGLVVRIAGGTATPIAPLPADRDLLAATTLGGLPLLVGAGGLILLGDGSGTFTSLPTPTTDDLRTVLALPDGTAVAAGARGTILRLGTSAWELASPPAFTGEVTLLVPGADGGALAVAGDAIVVGPFLRIATFTRPLTGLPWTDLDLAFTRDGPPVPSLTYTSIYGVKSSVGDWTIAAAGSLQSFRLPNLAEASAPPRPGNPPLQGLPTGDVIVRMVQILMDDFNMNAYDEDSLYSTYWRSWTVSVARVIR